MGRKEAPSLLKFEWTPDEHKHIKVHDVRKLTEDDYCQRLTLHRSLLNQTVAKS